MNAVRRAYGRLALSGPDFRYRSLSTWLALAPLEVRPENRSNLLLRVDA